MQVFCKAFIATSLDGFIARPDGDIDWLHNPRYALSGEDFGYERHFSSMDALVMGRNTFELVTSFDTWPYGDKQVYVLSHGNPALDEFYSGVSVHGGDLHAVLDTIKGHGHRRLYIDGGTTIQGFIREKLLHQITITRIPVLLGEGIPLFGPCTGDVHLNHLETQSYPNGFVQSSYAIDHDGPG